MIPPPTPATVAAWLRRAVVVIGAAYLLVLPQFATRATFFGVQGLPGPLAVVALGLGLWLMPILLAASWVAEGRVRLPHPLLAVAAGLFVVGAVVSTLAASDKASALVRAAELAGLWAGMFALAQAVEGEGERRFLLAALVAAGVVSAAVAIHQATVGLPEAYAYFEAHRDQVLAAQHIEPGSWRETVFRERFFGGVQAALGHPNVLASFLMLAFFAAVGLSCEKWTEVRTRGARALSVVAAAAAGLCAVGLFLTQSRAAMAAVAVGAYWLVVALRVRRRRTRLILYVLPMILAAGALAAATHMDHPAVEAGLRTLRYRLDYWSATLRILASHGLAGVGLENFGNYYVQYKPAWAPEEVADPHNMALATWSTLGLAGLAALATLAAAAVLAWRRRARAASSPDREVGGTLEGHEAIGAPESAEATRTRDLTVAARTAQAGAPGAALPGLLIPTMALAAIPVVLTFLMGWGWGVAAAAVMAVLAGLLPAESPMRLEASGRPMRGLGTACIVGLVAFVLAEQVGTAVLEPPTAWAMLVVLVATLGPGRAAEASLEPSEASRAGRGSGRSCSTDMACTAPIERDRVLPHPARDGSAPGLALPMPVRFILILVAMAFCFAYAHWLVVPVAQERRLLREAAGAGLALAADEPARLAAELNPLAWEPDFLRASFWHREAIGAKGPEAALAMERALEGYRAALARHPRLRRAYLAMADCYLTLPGSAEDRHALTAAEVSLQQAAALYPTDIPTRLRLAEVLERLDRRDAALAGYRAVLRLDDQMPMAGRRLDGEVRREVEARVADLAGEVVEPRP